MKGMALTGLFGAVSLIVSYGILVPKQLEAFMILAAASTMAGFALGRLAADKAGVGLRTFLIFIVLVGCFVSTMAYVYFVRAVSANFSDIVLLAFLISALFFCFAFLLPIAGLV